MWAVLESLHLIFTVLGAGDTSDRTQFLASRSPQSTGGDRQVSRQCQSRVPEWESMALWEHRKAPDQPEVREAFLQEETPQLG